MSINTRYLGIDNLETCKEPPDLELLWSEFVTNAKRKKLRYRWNDVGADEYVVAVGNLDYAYIDTFGSTDSISEITSLDPISCKYALPIVHKVRIVKDLITPNNYDYDTHIRLFDSAYKSNFDRKPLSFFEEEIVGEYVNKHLLEQGITLDNEFYNRDNIRNSTHNYIVLFYKYPKPERNIFQLSLKDNGRHYLTYNNDESRYPNGSVSFASIDDAMYYMTNDATEFIDNYIPSDENLVFNIEYITLPSNKYYTGNINQPMLGEETKYKLYASEKDNTKQSKLNYLPQFGGVVASRGISYLDRTKFRHPYFKHLYGRDYDYTNQWFYNYRELPNEDTLISDVLPKHKLFTTSGENSLVNTGLGISSLNYQDFLNYNKYDELNFPETWFGFTKDSAANYVYSEDMDNLYYRTNAYYTYYDIPITQENTRGNIDSLKLFDRRLASDTISTKKINESLNTTNLSIGNLIHDGLFCLEDNVVPESNVCQQCNTDFILADNEGWSAKGGYLGGFCEDWHCGSKAIILDADPFNTMCILYIREDIEIPDWWLEEEYRDDDHMNGVKVRIRKQNEIIFDDATSFFDVRWSKFIRKLDPAEFPEVPMVGYKESFVSSWDNWTMWLIEINVEGAGRIDIDMRHSKTGFWSATKILKVAIGVIPDLDAEYGKTIRSTVYKENNYWYMELNNISYSAWKKAGLGIPDIRVQARWGLNDPYLKDPNSELKKSYLYLSKWSNKISIPESPHEDDGFSDRDIVLNSKDIIWCPTAGSKTNGIQDLNGIVLEPGQKLSIIAITPAGLIYNTSYGNFNPTKMIGYTTDGSFVITVKVSLVEDDIDDNGAHYNRVVKFLTSYTVTVPDPNSSLCGSKKESTVCIPPKSEKITHYNEITRKLETKTVACSTVCGCLTGCMNTSACNYNILANNADNSTCIYPPADTVTTICVNTQTYRDTYSGCSPQTLSEHLLLQSYTCTGCVNPLSGYIGNSYCFNLTSTSQTRRNKYDGTCNNGTTYDTLSTWGCLNCVNAIAAGTILGANYCNGDNTAVMQDKYTGTCANTTSPNVLTVCPCRNGECIAWNCEPCQNLTKTIIEAGCFAQGARQVTPYWQYFTYTFAVNTTGKNCVGIVDGYWIGDNPNGCAGTKNGMNGITKTGESIYIHSAVISPGSVSVTLAILRRSSDSGSYVGLSAILIGACP